MFLSKSIQVAVILVSGAWALSDMAHCTAGFNWNTNSLGQDPCTVGSMLDASCRGLDDYPYLPLSNTQHYLPPRVNKSDDLMCDCNTVMYSLYMACASCQGAQIYSWTQWIPQCDTIYVSRYPTDIAQGTTVPHWAYYNITSLPNEIWNGTVAMSIGRDPEGLPKQTTTLPPPSETGKITTTRSPTGSPGPVGSNTKSGSGIGATFSGKPRSSNYR